MIPLHDNIPSRTTPFVNYSLIGLCALAFFFQLAEPDDDPNLPTITERFALIPARVTHPDQPVEIPVGQELRQLPNGQIQEIIYQRPAAPAAVPVLLTFLTCTFLHGGWLHFLGNVWFLHIFGDNVEDRLGHFGYLLFYLAGGAAASFAHYITQPNSPIPTIGASGAIAAVMGAYMLLYPHSKVLTLIPIFVIMFLRYLPAPLFLGIWFVIQLWQGVGEVTAEPTAGVAWSAHIGGFAMGFAVAWILNRTHHTRPPVEIRRPDSERLMSRQVRLYPHLRRDPDKRLPFDEP